MKGDRILKLTQNKRIYQSWSILRLKKSVLIFLLIFVMFLPLFLFFPCSFKKRFDLKLLLILIFD